MTALYPPSCSTSATPSWIWAAGAGITEAHVPVRAGRVYDALTAAGVALEERDAFCVVLSHGGRGGVS